MRHCTLTASALTIALLSPWALAQHAHHDAAPAPAAANPSPAPAAAPGDALPWVEAEVRRVDAGNGKLTLRHGPIPNLDMPPMTMAFTVADPALLQGVQSGDRIRVTVRHLNGQYTVMAVQR